MRRRLLSRLLVSAAMLAALVAVLTMFAGSGLAGQMSAATANYAPKVTIEPKVVGTPQVGQTLTADPGAWTSDTTPTFAFQWERCNGSGAACQNIAGATGQSYVVQASDAGSTFRVAVTATNASGATTDTSNNTTAVPGTPTGTTASGAPHLTTEPIISGTPAVGRTLTATRGVWSSATAVTYTFQWQRCNGSGAACQNIAGANGQTYVVQPNDAGSTFRVVVTASNASGAASDTSNNTAAVPGSSTGGGGSSTPATGGIKLPNGKTSYPASAIKLPDRLVIDGVSFQPTHLSGRRTFLARFHVSDVNGNPVRGALVYALGIPYSWVGKATEVSTGTDGWANVSITPTRKMPIGRGRALVIFVRARVAGQPVLGGTSTRRLVQVTQG